MTDRDTIIRMARLYGTPVQEQNAEVEYRFTLEELGLLLSTACVIEREACAKVCEDNEVCIHLKGGKSLHPRFKDNGSGCDGDVYAAAIRARGETTSRGQA